MIEELHIDGFRSLDDVHLGSLGQINLIVGPLNSGKTNLLEAVFLFCSNGDPSLLYKVLGLRRVSPEGESSKEIISLLDWFWSAHKETHYCEIWGSWMGAQHRVCISRVEQEHMIPIRQESGSPEIDEQDKDLRDALAGFKVETLSGNTVHAGQLYVLPRKIRIDSPKVQNIHGRFMGLTDQGKSRALASEWTGVEDRGEEKSVMELLRSLDPDIEDVRLAADESGQASLRIHHKRNGRMPIEFLGAGFGKALTVACYVVSAKNGILMIDEFDASLHIAAQSQLIAFTMKAAKKHNVQLFISTHSLETLDAFLDDYIDASDLWSEPEQLRVIQLRRIGTRTEVRNLDAQKARRLREEAGFDLRRTV